jgi:hypothetical protein
MSNIPRDDNQRTTLGCVSNADGETIIPVVADPSAHFLDTDTGDSSVLWYKMNDNAANTIVLDNQGFSNGTSIRNTSDMHVVGQGSGAFLFNGTSDYIDTNNVCPHFQNAIFRKDFSISFWLKSTATGVFSGVVIGCTEGEDSLNELNFIIQNNIIRFNLKVNNTESDLVNQITNNLVSGTYYDFKIVCEQEGDYVTNEIWIDDILQHSVTSSEPMKLSDFDAGVPGLHSPCATYGPYIGAYPKPDQDPTVGDFFKGEIYDFKIYTLDLKRSNAILDENSVPAVTALSSDGDGTVVNIYADASSKKILINSN